MRAAGRRAAPGEGALRPGKHTPAMNIQHETLREHSRGPQKPTGSVFQPAKCQFAPSKWRYSCWRLQGPVTIGKVAHSCGLRMHLLSFFIHILEEVSFLFPGRTLLPYVLARRDTELPDSSTGASATVFPTTQLLADRCCILPENSTAVSPSLVRYPLCLLLLLNSSDALGEPRSHTSDLIVIHTFRQTTGPDAEREHTVLLERSHSDAGDTSRRTPPRRGRKAAETRRRERTRTQPGRTAAGS